MESAPSSFLKRIAKLLARGFTLIEMLVVLVIITIITGIALVGQSNFNQTVFLTDTAYSVALSIREMQSLGLSSRKYSTVQNPGYGAYFTTTDLTAYTLFADIVNGTSPTVPTNCPVGTTGLPDSKPGNCLYDVGAPAATDAIVSTNRFTRGFTISRFCGRSGATYYCSNSGTASQRITELNVAFLRSDTETVLNGKRASDNNWVTLTSAEIYLQSPDTTSFRGICISRIGQVSVTQTTCDASL